MSSSTNPSTDRRWYHYWPWPLTAVVLLALVVGTGYAIWRFVPRSQRYQIPFQQIEVQVVPDHVGSNFLEEVRRLGGFAETLDGQQPDLIPQLTEAFARHPWVERVDQLNLRSRGRITVELTFRTPIASVTLPNSLTPLLLDRHGVVLPPSTLSKEVLEQVMVIEGVKTPSAGLPGQPYGRADVEAAARLAAILRPDHQRFKLVSIRLGADPLVQDLRLQTAGGSEIIWQDFNGRQDEVPMEEKLRRLRAYCDEFGSLDQPEGPYLFDLRHPDTLLRQSRR